MLPCYVGYRRLPGSVGHHQPQPQRLAWVDIGVFVPAKILNIRIPRAPRALVLKSQRLLPREIQRLLGMVSPAVMIG